MFLIQIDTNQLIPTYMILMAMGLLFAGDEYDGEHTESFCGGGGDDADIWFVACSAFTAALNPKKGGKICMVL